jgi:hypothetical protein
MCEFRPNSSYYCARRCILDPIFDVLACFAWLQNDPTSFDIFNSDGIGTHYQLFSDLKNVLLYPRSAGFTEESKVRLTQKVIANLTSL